MQDQVEVKPANAASVSIAGSIPTANQLDVTQIEKWVSPHAALNRAQDIRDRAERLVNFAEDCRKVLIEANQRDPVAFRALFGDACKIHKFS